MMHGGNLKLINGMSIAVLLQGFLSSAEYKQGVIERVTN
jgi:hypothetical protein